MRTIQTCNVTAYVGRTLPAPDCPKACEPGEPYVIFQVEPDGLRFVETHRTLQQATHFAEVMNNHEVKNGRIANYYYGYAPKT